MITPKLADAILRFAQAHTVFQASDVLQALPQNISRQYLNRIMGQLVDAGELARNGGGRYTYYSLPRHSHDLPNTLHKRIRNRDLRDYIVFENITKQLGFWRTLPENVRSIINYAFTEMFNNAMEHSGSAEIEVDFRIDKDVITFEVRDNGIGVFRNVMKKYGLNSQVEAAQELLKGKATTAPQAHSGEGIFFTSKVADSFTLNSYGEKLTVDNRLDDVFIEELRQLRGTAVLFSISRDTTTHLQDIFVEFQSEPDVPDFEKTEIYVKLFTMGTVHVSRSQAKRVMAGLSGKFTTVTLDFDKVPGIGQAFADEIFRVYTAQHPDVQILTRHANPTVQFMIDRVRNTRR